MSVHLEELLLGAIVLLSELVEIKGRASLHPNTFAEPLAKVVPFHAHLLDIVGAVVGSSLYAYTDSSKAPSTPSLPSSARTLYGIGSHHSSIPADKFLVHCQQTYLVVVLSYMS